MKLLVPGARLRCPVAAVQPTIVVEALEAFGHFAASAMLPPNLSMHDHLRVVRRLPEQRGVREVAGDGLAMTESGGEGSLSDGYLREKKSNRLTGKLKGGDAMV